MSMLNTSLMTQLGQVMQMGSDVVKSAARARAAPAPAPRPRRVRARACAAPAPFLSPSRSPAAAAAAATPSSSAVARQAVKGMGQDARFFRDSKRGEVGELRTELASSDLDVMKDAVKKVIAAITVGKDMNALFPDVINWCVRGRARGVSWRRRRRRRHRH
jgi:hypothetical protein